jgi:glycosyltransferase 2 family protein
MGTFIRRWGKTLLKCAILALVVWGGHRTIAGGLAELRKNSWEIGQLQPGWAVLAGVLYLVSQLPCGWFWHSVLVALGQTVETLRALRAFYIGHLGKYVPGKAMVVVLRAALVSGPACSVAMGAVAVFYETFTTMAVGAVMAAAILLVEHRQQTVLILGSLALAVIVGVPTLPFVFVRLMRFIKLAGQSASAPSSLHLGFGLSLRGWLAIAAGWIVAGGSLWCTVRAIGVEGASVAGELPLFTAIVALSVAWGFVSMLPAGLGVREIVLLQLLAPRLEQLMPGQGEQLALVAAIVLRLIWLASEIVLAAALYPLGKRSITTGDE